MNSYTLGSKIQGLRKSRGMTQKELADFLGYSESYISYVEKGERNISVNDIQKIAKIFSVDIDFLLEKPKITHFRADCKTSNNHDVDYDKIMDDFFNFVDEKLK